MTATVAIFNLSKLRTIWFDADGLLRAIKKPSSTTARPRRKRTFTVMLGASLVAATTAILGAPPPGQLSLTWPAAATQESIRQSLADSLHQIRQLKAQWNGLDAPAPVERSISAAHYILPQLPELRGDAIAGVDSEGHVFLKFTQGARVALLTVEPRVMHLVYMAPGQPTVYKEDQDFNGKILPADIKKVLASFKA